jgi:hypothetical protein
LELKEVADMSERCFKITGNFQQYGKWSSPDPGFIGYIVVDDMGVFEGYLEEQYSSDIDPLRFITGIYSEESKESIQLAYYKLASSSLCAPLLYDFRNILETGQWIAFGLFGPFFGGEAKVELIASVADHLLRGKIQEIKERVLDGNDKNRVFVLKAAELVEVFDVDL